MPETAAELAGRPLSDAELDDPARNALLGGRYLGQLLQRWNGDPLLAVASYNAGPNAVARWLPNGRVSSPELWVEAIPYPETRHYVKTVLGNTWSFATPRRPACT
jgi:soluble lytic murein transglycosylase